MTKNSKSIIESIKIKGLVTATLPNHHVKVALQRDFEILITNYHPGLATQVFSSFNILVEAIILINPDDAAERDTTL